MLTIYERLHKKYDKKLVEHKAIKKDWKKRKEALEEVGVTMKQEDDASYFQYEIIEKSLAVKTTYEDCFFDTYVTMYDYWKDLTYLERKKQMNVEIRRVQEELPHFTQDEQEIYMPCFNPKFNHLYTDEIVLLDLKQYHTFIRSFASQIEYDYYGVQTFLHHFSSAQVIVYKGNDFVLYHDISNRFYLYKQGVFEKALSFDTKRHVQDDDEMVRIAKALLEEDETKLIELILEGELVSKRMHKKIASYQRKRLKKQQIEKKKNTQE